MWQAFALHFIGLTWLGEKVSLFLETGNMRGGGLELPRCPGQVVPGNA